MFSTIGQDIVIAPVFMDGQWVKLPAIIYPAENRALPGSRFIFSVITVPGQNKKLLVLALLEAQTFLGFEYVPAETSDAEIMNCFEYRIEQFYSKLISLGITGQELKREVNKAANEKAPALKKVQFEKIEQSRREIRRDMQAFYDRLMEHFPNAE